MLDSDHAFGETIRSPSGLTVNPQLPESITPTSVKRNKRPGLLQAMKKIWSKKRFQKNGHSNRTFGRFTHVFRSCRKQSYDSETTEDEATEPQIPLEGKEGARGFQDEAQRVPAGQRMMDVAPDTSDHWAGGETSVLEREAPSLGSRAPGQQSARQANSREPTGTQIRHLGVEPLIRASRANLSRPVWGSEESVSLASDYYGSTFSLYRGRTFSVPL
ncbi:striated muscle-specific serine/threonine-protein kinase-like isoform X2 [Triplophysa dalaica]|uniref:striated muscle-specific serine/threonine-protein kinase-like isoform X2 n=1 Tax=Triplophysa dalaica TaxID=1582913 RepID=UPI0024DFAF95|nr:striated muscle-specific serine/threonine-protein kinase-like isoform X2 [Triplophysa dalaica]